VGRAKRCDPSSRKTGLFQSTQWKSKKGAKGRTEWWEPNVRGDRTSIGELR